MIFSPNAQSPNPATCKDVSAARLDWYFSPLEPAHELNLPVDPLA